MIPKKVSEKDHAPARNLESAQIQSKRIRLSSRAIRACSPGSAAAGEPSPKRQSKIRRAPWIPTGPIKPSIRIAAGFWLLSHWASLPQSKRGFDRVYGGQQTEQARELWTFNKVNCARIAEDMGALGIRVEHPSGLQAALAQALAANRPAVIDVVTDSDALAPLAKS